MRIDLKWYVKDKDNEKKSVYYILVPRKIAKELLDKKPVLDLQKGIIIFENEGNDEKERTNHAER